MLPDNKARFRFFQDWNMSNKPKKPYTKIIQDWEQNKNTLTRCVSFKQYIKLVCEGFTVSDIVHMYEKNILTVTK